MMKYSLTTLRGAAPVEEKTAPAYSRDAMHPQPRGGWPIRFILLIAAALSLAGFIFWFAYLSPVTVSAAPNEVDVPEQVYGLGTVGARIQSNVGFKVSGVLAALNADQGDRVRKGQVLAMLDAGDVEAQLAVAKAVVGQARASIEKAKADAASANANLINANAVAARRAALVKKGFTTVEET
ncbi:MAG: biotin/lipoyl-binding protein, partial [Rhodomicrobium sp.]|nr:biotin/lipoyl-binding protein [Rhodomicrobium sp.]